MKCSQCGAKTKGNYCPNCGAVIEKLQKTKKPFYKKWWFWLIVVIAVLIVLVNSNNNNNSKKLVWEDMILGETIPEAPAKKGIIYTNSTDELWVDVDNVSDKLYAEYIEACKENGFIVDEKSTSFTYDAYNSEGYKLSLSHIAESLDIKINAPMEFENISWPNSIAGNKIPTPKSTTGKFSFENEDSFFVYVSKTAKDDFKEYVSACSDMGFNVDYNKGNDYYYADDSEGWHISLKYEGNNIMTIDIDPPAQEDDIDETSSSIETSKPISSQPQASSSKIEVSSSSTSNSDYDWRDFLKDYEAWVDDYVSIYKKYMNNPNDLTIMNDYFEMLGDMAEWGERADNFKDDITDPSEAAEYVATIARIATKLASAL